LLKKIKIKIREKEERIQPSLSTSRIQFPSISRSTTIIPPANKLDEEEEEKDQHLFPVLI